MDAIRETGRWLVTLGILLVIAGGFLISGSRLPLRLGHLPGDIVYHGRQTSVYLPMVTCIVLSVALTLVFWVVSLLRR